MRTEQWYQDQFGGYDVPERLKQTAIAIMQRFTIRGICDGMYIANCIAYDCGIGNGQGSFVSDNPINNVDKAAEFLQSAYGCNIFPEDLEELQKIIRTGKLDIQEAEVGIRKYIDYCKKELATAPEIRKSYYKASILEAVSTLQSLEHNYSVLGERKF